ncbi:MAG: beta-lactamase family protein [Candidatus Eremiobacteraeota bacterium]|nr:beta-lactamase family protein [Candidatus Eremiobacteraeota bacterium]
MKRRLFLAGLLGVGAALSVEGVAASDVDGQLQQALELAHGRGRSPGLIAGVWKGEQALWTSAVGVSDRSVHTRVGSVTKTMVGSLILQLVDEGKVGLRESVARWFPELPRASEVTVEMLGRMSSGIASYTFSSAFTDVYFAKPQTVWKEDELLKLAFGLPRVFEPGKGFQYCNTNFVMLGRIVEKERGVSLGEALRTHLWEPLGMGQSSYPTGTDLPEPYWHGFTLQGTAEGTTEPVDATHWSPTFGAGAGQAVSDFHDLGLWARALGRGTTLKAETQRLRLLPNSYSSKGERSYCFGVGVENGWIGHAGTLPGYNTQVAYLPERDLSIVVMANSDVVSDHGLPAVDAYQLLAAVVAPDRKPL